TRASPTDVVLFIINRNLSQQYSATIRGDLGMPPPVIGVTWESWLVASEGPAHDDDYDDYNLSSETICEVPYEYGVSRRSNSFGLSIPPCCFLRVGIHYGSPTERSPVLIAERRDRDADEPEGMVPGDAAPVRAETFVLFDLLGRKVTTCTHYPGTGERRKEGLVIRSCVAGTRPGVYFARPLDGLGSSGAAPVVILR
ncbi:MAG: hypothetical protein MUE60_11905, partial [Candidatus Eisenbacteria bacterium]|nr:hypothetical protein [Candidatus Eisenbacteria bacterium]